MFSTFSGDIEAGGILGGGPTIALATISPIIGMIRLSKRNTPKAMSKAVPEFFAVVEATKLLRKM